MTTTGPAWLPSADRTIPLFAYAARAPVGRQATPLPLEWPRMAPGDLLDFTLDCTAWVAGTADAVATAAATAYPADVTPLAAVVVGGLVVVWLASGASASGPHVITVTITTASGQVTTAPVALFIDPAEAALAPIRDALADQAAAVLLAEDGTPLLIDYGGLPATFTLPDGTTVTPQPGIMLP